MNVAKIIQNAFAGNEGFALFRMPDSNEIRLIFGPTHLVHGTNSIGRTTEGYLIQPFDTGAKALLIEKKNEVTVHFDEFTKDNPEGFGMEFFYSIDNPAPTTSKEHYTQFVDASVELIRNKEYKKLVCANIEKCDTPNPQPLSYFIKLCESFPNGFISLQSTPEFGTWLGTSPEILLEVKDAALHTVALAGTQLQTEQVNAQNAVWTQKDIEEQALVSRYIINCFKSIRLREFEEEGPRTVEAGNLLHLKTDFFIDMKDTEIKNLPFVLLPLLHPTSAVCGMPKDKAMLFIQENEGFDRQLYAGYHGPVNGHHEMNLFVNLRCAQITKEQIIYYAGAGITGGSDSEKEWIETQNKKSGTKEIIGAF